MIKEKLREKLRDVLRDRSLFIGGPGVRATILVRKRVQKIDHTEDIVFKCTALPISKLKKNMTLLRATKKSELAHSYSFS